jgi:hypothetical protein
MPTQGKGTSTTRLLEQILKTLSQRFFNLSFSIKVTVTLNSLIHQSHTDTKVTVTLNSLRLKSHNNSGSYVILAGATRP